MKKRGRFQKRGALAVHPKAFELEFEVDVPGTHEPEIKDGVAIVTICGPLTHHAEWFWDSYESIIERVRTALESPAKAVILDIDSPGGDVAGCYETSRELRAMAEAAGKKIYAVANSLCASGAYALACAADRIACPETAYVGSVGVVTQLVDQTALDRAMGLNFVVITSGARKADGHPHVPISDGAKQEAKSQCDSLAEGFFAWVAEARSSRGLSVEKVRALEAGIFHGQEAVDVGLADVVMTKDQLLAAVASGETEPASAAPEDNMLTKKAAKAEGGDDSDVKKYLRKRAEGGDEDAKKLLADMDGDNDGDKKNEDEGDGADASAADDKPPPVDDKKNEDEEAKKAAKAEADDDKKKDDAKAHANVLTRVGKLERALEAEKAKNLAAEKTKLLEARTDLTAGQREYLSSLSLEQMKRALAEFPAPADSPTAVRNVEPARGEGRGGDRAPRLPPKEAAEMRERMGLAPKKVTVRREGASVVFPAMTRDEARASGETRDGGAK